MFDPIKRSAMRLPAGLALIALVFAACAGAGASSPPAGSTAPSAASETTAPATPGASEVPGDQVTGDLTVLDWAGYDDPLYWQDFKDTYPNVNVNFEFGDSDGTSYGLMKGGDQADVFHPYTGWVQFYADEGLAARSTPASFSNWDKVPDLFKKMGEVNGKQ